MNNKSIGNIFKGDKVIWMVFFFLCMISIVEVYSASSSLSYKTGNYMAPVIRHILLLGGGLFTMICMLKVKCKYFKIVTPVVMGISFLLLVLVLATGQTTNGSLPMVLSDGHTVPAFRNSKGSGSTGCSSDS